MLANFHLCALVPGENHLDLFRIPLHQTLQDALTLKWEQQLHNFIDNVDEIEPDMAYSPEPGEQFRLTNFSLSEPLVGVDSMTTQNLDAISKFKGSLESIRGLVAFCTENDKGELVLFQNFTRSSVIEAGSFLFLEKNTFKSASEPAITIDTKLAAVYQAEKKKLLFHNFRIANTFIPLTDYLEEASEHDIRQMLAHKSVFAEDPDALAVGANQWFRKRFALLKASKVLDNFTPSQIKKRSQGHDVIVAVKMGKIVFPADIASAKKLLQFLNEELYRGPITNTLYETNSKRKAGK